MKRTEEEKKALRVARLWKLLRKPVTRFMHRRFGYDCAEIDVPEGAFLLYANHVTDLDPVFVGCATKTPLVYVAGENVRRMGFLTRLIDRYAYTIDRYKGGTDAACALQILRTLRGGSAVCMFPAGERSYLGKSVEIPMASAKLAKSARVPLITYRLVGGYMTSPRWADTMRRGKMAGEWVHIYMPEELKTLSVEELHAKISADLFEDAYAAPPAPYHGKQLAERLETMLYLCPSCGKIDTLRSSGNRFFCACGLETWLNEEGRFEGAKPFAHPGAWDDWQQGEMQRIAAAAGEAVVLSDEGQQLYRTTEDHKLLTVAAGTMSMSGETFRLGSFSAPLSALDGFALTQKDKLSFTMDGAHYVIRSDHSRCGKKYCDFFRYRRKTAEQTD
ncbi:MAG: 1-acyl-sn-glycerol-3-phosphate acyltransferase [Clostridia bacterium]|nr:1-acyl-sn-glycerol-3-phosphate acyltransferase [Clostridia bacterium]